MATIMVQHHGGETRRCDASCHDAHGPVCACVCGGRYHGKGRRAERLLERDVESGRLGPEMQAAYQAARGGQGRLA